MGTEGSVTCLQELATGSCPESDEFSPPSYTVPLRFFLILTSHLLLAVPSGLFPSGNNK
jgi:hypothetical protein